MASHSSEAGSWLDRVLGAAAGMPAVRSDVADDGGYHRAISFNWPLRGAFEITELLLLTLIFAGLPLASRADEHVTLDFIDMLLGPKGRSCLRRVVDLVCGIMLLALAWRVWVKAGKIAAYGDTTDVLRVPVTPFVYFMTAMVVLTGLVHLAKVIFQPPPRGQQFDPEKTGTA